MKRRLSNSWFVIPIAFTLVILTTTGCNSPYSVKRVSPLQLFVKRDKTALNSNHPSPRTLQYLRLRFLTQSYKTDPASLIEQLHQETFHSNDMSLTLALSELAFLQGKEYQRKNPVQAFTMYLIAAEVSYRYLLNEDLETVKAALQPDTRLTAEVYKHAVSNLIGLAIESRSNGTHLIRENCFETNSTHYSFALEPSIPPRIDPLSFDELIPANQFEVNGLSNEYFSYGLGVPLIGIVHEPHQREQWGPFFPGPDFMYPLSGVLKFDAPKNTKSKRQVHCSLGFYDPLATDTITLEQHNVPLEADYTTALAFQVQKLNPTKIGFKGLLESDLLLERAGLYLLEPYRPDKIPVVMVHGLMSSAMTWVPMFNDLRGSPDLRDRYQFWFFNYPTGLPILYSSMLLREQLKAVRDTYDPNHNNPNFDHMVLVGHSMGGLLTRMMLINPGDAFYNYVFDEPIEQLPVSDDMRELVKKLFLFERQKNISRAIFISTPHRGSSLADRWYAKLGTGLIHLPRNMMQSANTLLSNKDIQYTEKIKNESQPVHTSIQLLSPSSPFIRQSMKFPLPQDIPYHSIIGIRDAKQGPGSSDGVVDYESSHLEYAVSELWIPSSHSAHCHPLAIQEVKRILRLHLQDLHGRTP